MWFKENFKYWIIIITEQNYMEFKKEWYYRLMVVKRDLLSIPLHIDVCIHLDCVHGQIHISDDKGLLALKGVVLLWCPVNIHLNFV